MKIYYHCFLILAIFGISSLCVRAQTTGQKIGNNPTIKNPSALLEIESTNKGTLLPRVSLASTVDVATITAPANGLTVFNIAEAGVAPNKVTPGYYFWSGAYAKWIKLLDNLIPNDWLIIGNGNVDAINHFIGTNNAQDLVIKTNNTEQMRVTAAGFVGVGRNPTATLDVNGNAIISDKIFPRNSTTGRSAYFLFSDNLQPYTSSGFRAYHSNDNNNSHLSFRSSGASEIQSYSSLGASPGSTEILGTESDLYLSPRGAGVVIGNITSAPQRLDLGEGSMRVRNLYSSIGNESTDRRVVADVNGTLKTISAAAVVNVTMGFYVMTPNDESVFVDATIGGTNITLPPASAVSGIKYYIKKVDNTPNGIQISAFTGDSMENNPPGFGIPIFTPWQCCVYQSDGVSRWHLIQKFN